ncbi:hypothetical protein Aperf_G00000068749 [Anoplocephala perfoliata]
MSDTDKQILDKTVDKHGHYIIKSGDSISSVAAKFDLTPSRLCQLNKLCSHHLFAGERLKVVREETKHPKHKEDFPNIMDDYSEIDATSDVGIPSPSVGKRYKQIFRRITGAEMLEKSHMAKVLQADKMETNDPLAAGCLKVDARYCLDLHGCVKGTLIATIETLMFSPLDGNRQRGTLCQSAIEMRYENVRSVAAYIDPSVFVFTKRPRPHSQSTHDSNVDESRSPNQFTASQEGEITLQPVLQEQEVFLCCTVQRNRLTSAGTTSPTTTTPGAQWFIVSRKSIEDLDNFLIGSNLGFASVVPMQNESDKMIEGKGERENEKLRNIPRAIGSLIPRSMTLPFRSSQDSSGVSPRGYIGRLIHRTASAKQKNSSIDCRGGRRRPMSIGCSEELFSDHTPIDIVPHETSLKTGEDSDSTFFGRSSSSTPSFADEKEVFDVLRQTSLLWELVSEEEFLQRCILAEAGEEERKDGCDLSVIESAIPALLPIPTSVFQSCILTTEAQIQEEESSKFQEMSVEPDVFDAIPLAAQTFSWSLTFSTELHGFSLQTLYRRCDEFISGDLETSTPSEEIRTVGDFAERALVVKHKSIGCASQYQPCVLLIKDTTDRVMGAYLSSHPRVLSGSFYGSGESFVFHWTSASTSQSAENIVIEDNNAVTSKSKGNLRFKKYSWSGKNSFLLTGEHNFFAVGCSNARSALRIDESLNRGLSQACDTFDNPELTPGGDFFIYALELWSLT